jgi:hypothetical protein
MTACISNFKSMSSLFALVSDLLLLTRELVELGGLRNVTSLCWGLTGGFPSFCERLFADCRGEWRGDTSVTSESVVLSLAVLLCDLSLAEL